MFYIHNADLAQIEDNCPPHFLFLFFQIEFNKSKFDVNAKFSFSAAIVDVVNATSLLREISILVNWRKMAIEAKEKPNFRI